MTTPFQLAALPALARSAVDRAESLRADAEGLAAGWAKARVLRVDVRGRVPLPEGAMELALREATAFGDHPPEGAVYLGRAEGGGDLWALVDTAVPEGETVWTPGRFGVWAEHVVADGELWVGLREHGDQLDDAGAGLFTTALALRNWHRRAKFCARCGAATRLANFGWVSRCTECDREEYPRTDPAVICLVHDEAGVNGEHVLLARGANWPEQARSVLAGFVEAGESLEACVIREIREEVGVAVRDVRYLGSQPWPFPRSIMIGFAARADRGAPLVLEAGEIEDAQWFSRAEIAEALARADRAPEPDELILPGNASIARGMLESWAHAQN